MHRLADASPCSAVLLLVQKCTADMRFLAYGVHEICMFKLFVCLNNVILFELLFKSIQNIVIC
jgi:hypothetical protein